jgi:protein-ribulosamine 3-kinase
LKATIYSNRSVGGGSICDSRLLETSKGKYFLKMNHSSQTFEMFESEVSGLQLLSSAGLIKIPEVIYYSQADNVSFLLLEYIERGTPSAAFWIDFGVQLAALHQITNKYFGLDSDNFIGSLAQSNQPTDKWVDFFINERLQKQIELAIEQNAIDKITISKFELLFKKLPDIFPEEQPALIHGDLWNGNFLVNSNGKPVIFDPSVCFAHREMDLAMSHLFGGFDQLFYEAYHEFFPIEKGFDQRLEIYQLYYLMVHVNLFGGGYLKSVKNILSRFVD